MTNKSKLPTTSASQRRRFLASLIEANGSGITSHYANKELGIYHPPARVKELRQRGYNIATLWETIETEISCPRRVARYVLLSQTCGASVSGSTHE